MARALLCMELSGLQGKAPGSLAEGGAEEAAGELTPRSACLWGAGVGGKGGRFPCQQSPPATVYEQEVTT